MLFLTGKEKDADGNPLPGDGWTLVEDYPDPVEGSEEPQSVRSDSEDTGMQSPSVQSTPSVEQDAADLTDTVTYGGKEYTLEELKKLIG